LRTRLFILVFLGTLLSPQLRSQDDSLPSNTTQINKARFITTVSGFSAAYLGSMAYLQYIWYEDVPRVKFEFYNDLGGYNQIDKCGHIFGSYLESYIGYKSLLWAGVPEKKAAIYGGSLGFMLQLPIEIWDGMYEGWGFSWSDVAANTIGSAFVIGQQLAFHDQVVKLKFTFSPSPYAPLANGYLGEGFNQLFYDYNSHTYWLSTGITRVIRTKKIPDWINFAVGYSAGGMYGEFENKTRYGGVAIPPTERYRQFLFSLDVDFTRIPVRSKFLKSVFNKMFMIKVPFPAIEWNTKGEFKFHSIYY
jgi:uncharacterized protein YfiM (DUF2279 family)